MRKFKSTSSFVGCGMIRWCRLPRARPEMRVIRTPNSQVQTSGCGIRPTRSLSTTPWKKQTASHIICCKLKSSPVTLAARNMMCWEQCLHTSKIWLGSAMSVLLCTTNHSNGPGPKAGIGGLSVRILAVRKKGIWWPGMSSKGRSVDSTRFVSGSRPEGGEKYSMPAS